MKKFNENYNQDKLDLQRDQHLMSIRQNGERIGDIEIVGGIFGTKKKIFGLEFVWWGQSQWYKWRWNQTHIDMGWFSIYGLPNKGVGKYFWRLIALCCKPMRIMYHKRFVPKSKKLEEVVKDFSHFR